MQQSIEYVQTEDINKRQEIIEFKRKFAEITNSDEDIISIKFMLASDNHSVIYQKPFQSLIIEKDYKRNKEEDESYFFIEPYFLIKYKLLKKMEKTVSKTNFKDDLKSELNKNGISF